MAHLLSLLVRKPGGPAVGYPETGDYAAARTAMDAEQINLKWQAVMGLYFIRPEGARPVTVRSGRPSIPLA